MTTLSVQSDLYVFKLKAYKIILKVKKIQLPTYYRFYSTEEGEYGYGLIGLRMTFFMTLVMPSITSKIYKHR